MKTLQQFAEKHSCTIKPITFKFQGFTIKRKGYALISADGKEAATFEPCSYNDSTGYKWFVKFSGLFRQVINNTNKRAEDKAYIISNEGVCCFHSKSVHTAIKTINNTLTKYL